MENIRVITQEADVDEIGENTDKQDDDSVFAYLDYCG